MSLISQTDTVSPDVMSMNAMPWDVSSSEPAPLQQPAAATNLLPLRLLAPGQTALIHEVLGRVDQVHRLHELGLRRGVQIEMVRSGSPCIVRLGGHKLCFRADDLMSVLVTPGVLV